MTISKKILFVIVLAVIVFAVALPAQAADPLVMCGRTGQPACQPCDFLTMFKRIVDFFTFTLTPIIGTTLILFSGFVILISGGNSERIGAGKKMLTNTVIAIVIIYASFLIVNFFIQSLAGDNNTATSWFKLECKNNGAGIATPSSSTSPVPTNSGPLPTSGSNTGGTTKTPSGSKTPGGFQNSMSPAIAKLRTCISSKLSTSFATVTSTTDNNIAAGKCDPLDPNETFNDKVNNCSHAKNSCHYGGSEPACQQYGSYALDYVSTDRATSNQMIANIALECDPKAFTLIESVGTNNEHVHISVGDEYGCGCDKVASP